MQCGDFNEFIVTDITSHVPHTSRWLLRPQTEHSRPQHHRNDWVVLPPLAFPTHGMQRSHFSVVDPYPILPYKCEKTHKTFRLILATAIRLFGQGIVRCSWIEILTAECVVDQWIDSLPSVRPTTTSSQPKPYTFIKTSMCKLLHYAVFFSLLLHTFFYKVWAFRYVLFYSILLI